MGLQEDFIDLGTAVSKKSYHHLRLSPMRPNELWTCPDDGAARAPVPDCQRSSCGSVRRGRGGDRYSQPDSDTVKVKGEDPATPGDYPRSVDTARTPRDRNDFPISA